MPAPGNKKGRSRTVLVIPLFYLLHIHRHIYLGCGDNVDVSSWVFRWLGADEVIREPEIVLYDLACTKNICFSPAVWRIRLILNYKLIPYRTVFLEFPDIEPTLKGLSLVLGESASGTKNKYTVPAIRHVPTNTYMMDSVPIAQFLESIYPDPVVLSTSELGREIEAKARAVIGTAFRTLVMPREMNILSPPAQEYFRRTREASLGHRLEDLLEQDKQEQAWDAVGDGMRAVSKLLRTHKADGPFVIGAWPSGTDFFVAGALHSVSVVDEGVFQRIIKDPAFGEIYGACLPYMEKND
ncbi:hypothetical protein K458DRAFT_478750 [Lentithecium fluviatile CBS 122367]|uniref:Uncharacterized protein n=1 Tax=Lentithecium fluviatile CBS 122367 TaxID=1168545 RepID=A0A6G1IY11_9PLEO|nr:hypothetical protein K458DRAFT_478750 [Lentithecium fluviatile CBS 122367]